MSADKQKKRYAVVQLKKVKAPRAASSTGRSWIYYDQDNLLPNRLVDLFHEAGTHASLITLKAEMIKGDGVVMPENEETRIWLEGLDNQEGIDELVYKLGRDLCLFNGFALQVEWVRGRIRNLYHQDFEEVRLAKCKNGEPRHYYLCADWAEYSQNRPVKIAGYDPLAVPKPLPAAGGMQDAPLPDPDADEPVTQLYYFRRASKGLLKHYPLPDYFASLAYIQVEADLAAFNAANVNNAFLPSSLIVMPDDMPEDDQEQFEREMKDKFSGPDNAGKFVIVYKDGEDVVDVKPLSLPSNATVFDAVDRATTQKVISAHRLPSPVLAGIPGNGNLSGNAREIQVAAELFYNTVIKEKQNTVTRHLNRLLRRSEHPAELSIANSQPVSFILAYADILSQLREVLSVTEQRELLGYGPQTI